MLPSHHRCHRHHHRPTPALSLWTMATIDDDDAVRPKNVPWNWPMLSIGTTGEEGARGRQRRRQRRQRRPRLCGWMTGPSSTARRGRGRFSHPDGGDAEEDRGRNGNNGTPNDRGSGEERDDGSAPHTTAGQLEGEGWRNNATATDDDGRSLTRPGGRSTRPPVVAYRHRRTGSG